MLTTGERLGPYEILVPIGEGGMGEVYKARDTRLDRIVALKISKREFTERFEREARAVAALNHSHICQLYDVGPNFLVMEFAEGEPLLSQKMPGPLPLEKALEYSRQILDALDHAHRAKITHRDLKPANIMLTKQGVKLLDFGLAKLETTPLQQADATLTQALTKQGQIVGTLQYMSPEQLQGQEADARSDIFSFGAVLYEMLSGKRAFEGSSAASVIAAILERQPAPLELSPPLDRVIRACLEKDPERRIQTARDVKLALEWAAAPEIAVPKTALSRSRLGIVGWIAAAVVLLAAGLGAWRFWPRPAPPHVMRFEVPLPDKVNFGGYIAVSPDGQKLVMNGTGEDSNGLWIRNLDSLEWRRLPETQGASAPFWSPDSRFLGFASASGLKKIDITGGPPQTLCQLPGSMGAAAWSSDGTILYHLANGGPLWRVSEAGGVPSAITSVDLAHGEAIHALPSFLPDGHFLYVVGGAADVTGIYLGSLDVKPAEQSKRHILVSQLYSPSAGVASNYIDGHMFFLRADTLMALPLDAGKLQLKGDPVPIAEHVAATGAIGAYSVSPSGVLAYRAGAASQDFQLTWFDRQGKISGTVGQPGPYHGFAVAPDGMRAAGRDAVPQALGDIWTFDFTRGVRTRLTFHQSTGSYPVWSPDGSRIAFFTGDTLLGKASSGAGEEKMLYRKEGETLIPTNWSRDGRFLLCNTIGVTNDLSVLPLEGDRKPARLLHTQFNEVRGVFSPDMRWIAYASDESGRPEIYVRPFVASGPNGAPALGDGKWQVSRDGAVQGPKWRADGKEIIFGAPDGALMAVEVNGSGAAFQMGTPQKLVTLPPNASLADVTADGKRFLITVPAASQNAQTPITVILNWPALLKK